MIDFRYHLVSIASIFLALAVGIVLGAGPLKGTIGDTLTSEVTRLREDANTLRADLAAAEQRALAREELLTELRPRAVSGLLSGDSVSMLVLPGAAESQVEDVRIALLEAGASVSTLVTLEPSMTSQDPPPVADRTAAAAGLREAFATDLPVGASADEVITVALGWALASMPSGEGGGDDSNEPPTDSPTDTPADQNGLRDEDAADPGEGVATEDGAETGSSDSVSSETGSSDGSSSNPEPSDDLTPGVDATTRRGALRADEMSRQILDILAEAGLLSHTSDGLLGDSAGVVVITPEAAEVPAEDVTSWAGLLASFNELTAVTVVGEVSEGTALEANLVATVRDDSSLSAGISTIDNVGTPLGRLAVPFVVSEEVAGAAGHYGDLDSAADAFPAIPAAER